MYLNVIIKLKMTGGFTCSGTMLTATLTAMLTESQEVQAKSPNLKGCFGMILPVKLSSSHFPTWLRTSLRNLRQNGGF